MPRRLVPALAALAALAAPGVAQAHRGHCTAPPDPVHQAGDLRLESLGTIGSLTGVVNAPGEPARLYLSILEGAVRVMDDGALRDEPFLDLTSEIAPTVDIAENERGMQSIAFPPDYATSRRFYVFFSDARGDSQVVEFRTTPDGLTADPGTRRTILFVRHSFSRRHYGGQLAFGPGGRLYVSLGDANRAPWAQRRSLYGSIVSLDPERPKATRKWVAKGLRNPYRFTFDPLRGGLIIADVGEATYDEIDLLPRGTRGRPNYGWPYAEGPRVHNRRKLRRHVAPAIAYSHRIGTAVIGGHVVRDPRLPALRGRYLYGDFCDGFMAIARLHRRRPTTRMSGLVVPGLTTFGEDAAHRLYLGTAYGQLLRLDPAAPSGPSGM